MRDKLFRAVKSYPVVVVVLIAALVALISEASQSSAPTLDPYPDVTTTQTNASIALLSYKSVVEGNIATTFQLTQNNTAVIATLQAAVTSLTNTTNQQAQQIQTLQTQIAALQTPPPAQTTISFTGCPNGVLNGLWQGINLGSSGYWTCSNGALQPTADGQAQRSITFPKPVTIVSFTFSTTNAETAGITLTANTGTKIQQLAPGVNQQTTFTPGWSQISSFTVGGDSGATAMAPDLRIWGITYQ